MAHYDDQRVGETDFFATMRRRFNLAEEAERDIRTEALEDLQFASGRDQWPSDIKRDRTSKNLPTPSINKLPQFIRQVTGDQRQNRLGIKISPVGDKSDIDVAEAIQGLIRNIERRSSAYQAYDTAFEYAARSSFGYWRLNTYYLEEDSFEQALRIETIENPFSVYLDPAAKMPDASDMDYAFIWDWVHMDVYKEIYQKTVDGKDSELFALNDWKGIGDKTPDWFKDKDIVRIAEYYYKRFETKELIELNEDPDAENPVDESGAVGFKDSFDKEMVEYLGVATDPNGKEKSRRVQVPTIHWCKTNGIEKLEETIWVGKWIPIVPVYGESFVVDGKRVRESVIRHAKEPQQVLNYMVACKLQAIGLGPKAPWVAAAGQTEKYQEIWEKANDPSIQVLPYDPIDVKNHLVPPPQRNTVEPPIQAIVQAENQASEDLKSTIGIYGTGLGARSNETSGKAIQARQRESDTSHFHLHDNLSRALKHTGDMIVDAAPHVYDTDRLEKILGFDEQEKEVRITSDPKGEPVVTITDEQGNEIKMLNIAVGRYDVSVDSGPSVQTQRQETVEAMTSLVKAYPPLMEKAGDIILGSMDFPRAKELADRLVPAEFREKGKDIPPQVRAQLMQLQQTLEAITKERDELATEKDKRVLELQARVQEKELDVASKERIAALQGEIKLISTVEQLKSQEDRDMFKATAANLLVEIKKIREPGPVEGQIQSVQ